jgi:hypothetical protein
VTCPHTWADQPLDANDQTHRCNQDNAKHGGAHQCDCGAIDMTHTRPICALCGQTLDEHTVALYAPKQGLVEGMFLDAPGWRGVYCRGDTFVSGDRPARRWADPET